MSILRELMDESAWSADDLRAMLEHQWRTPLRLEREELVAAGGEGAAAIVDRAGDATFGDVLRDGGDAVPLVQALAKASLARPGDLPRDVARVLYVLAILRGRVTSLDPASVERETRRCLTFQWLPDDVRALIRDASSF